MKKFWAKHIFSAELPYEKDQIITLFLKEKFKKVDIFIMSTGRISNLPPCELLSYENGKLVKEKKYKKNNLNAYGLSLYFFYIPKALLFIAFYMLHSLKSIDFKCDIFFAQHFFPAFMAIILRRLGILGCEKIIFVMDDFYPIPIEFLRSLYSRGIDMMQGFIRKNVDEIWYTTPRLYECDKNRFGPLPKHISKRFIPGYFFRRIQMKNPPTFPPMRLVYLGALRKDTGIYEAIDLVNSCIKKHMNVELFVVGSGTEENEVKNYVEEKNLSRVVKFLGFENRGKEIAKIFSKCHLGVALYPTYPYSPNWYLTSGKCRRYISQRVPVIISTVPYFAKYIHDYNAGIIVDNDPDEVPSALVDLYNNPAILEDMRKGVDKLYSKYQADSILEEAFSAMFFSEKNRLN